MELSFGFDESILVLWPGEPWFAAHFIRIHEVEADLSENGASGDAPYASSAASYNIIGSGLCFIMIINFGEC